MLDIVSSLSLIFSSRESRRAAARIVDWLGGLPYEVAYGPEIRQLYGTCGFKLLREDIRAEGMCSYWLFEQTKLPAHVHHRQMIERPRP